MKVHLADWAGPLFDHYRYKVLYGGRSSGKTEAVAAALVVQGAEETHTMAIVREHEVSIKKSAKPALEKWIKRLGLEGPDGYEIFKTEIRHANGTWMFFSGMSKVSEEDIKGWHDVTRTWYEEAHMMSIRSRNLLYPTVFRQKNSEIWFTFNPQNRTDPVYRDFVTGNWGAGSRYVHKVNYLANPWFPEAEEELRIEWEKNDPQTYPHVWLGEPADSDADKQVLAYDVLLACVEAWKKGLAPPQMSAPVTDSGLDMAEGGKDKCAQVIRRGPVVEFLDVWPGVAGDLSVAAMRAHENTQPFDMYRLYYDASSPMKREFIALGTDYGAYPVNFGGEVGGKDVFYEPKRRNGEVFRSRNIQMADALRLRANRTLRLLKGDKIDPVECLFIRDDLPNLETFLADLTQPIRRQSVSTGKYELDKRGGDEKADSPDMFDALCLSFSRDSDNGLRVR